jgi:hypothetical protein
MTSAVGVERVVKRRRFHLHCACGAAVASSEKTAICTDCGETITFRRRRRLGWHRSSEENPAAWYLFQILGGLVLFVLVSLLADA